MNSTQRSLIFIAIVISCLTVLVAVVWGKGPEGGPTGPVPSAPISTAPQPKNALTQLAIDADYDIGGEPHYDAAIGRWIMSVIVPGCKVRVVLGGNKGPVTQAPEGISVLAIGDYRRPDSAPLTALAAEDLKRNPEWHRLLDCV